MRWQIPQRTYRLAAATLHSYEPVKIRVLTEKQGQVGSFDTCCPTQPEHDKYTDASIDPLC